MRWTKSSYSSTGATCVQVRVPRAGVTEIGDTKKPDGPTLTVPNSDWDHFLDQIAMGGTDFGRLRAEFLPGGGFTLTDTTRPGSPTLTYTRAEWEAFKLAVEAGELRSGHPRGTLVS
ncbi:DUF397 domain-containing protein [Nocardiopsis sp. YSL2]|uniref:DUF397 domain-containing protein n=1 Tax=Nocardiopsis sp. YSL2 TaxID=2939492 RepID=UPI0026F47DBE|nr:DUF397 domain-containing protein [Nocardiopsis sp. YSL2]